MHSHALAHRPVPLMSGFPTFVIWLVASSVFLVFIAIVFNIFAHGLENISWDYLSTVPLDAGRAGGIASILSSTVLILLVCMAVAVPLGLGTAILLAEYLPLQSRPAQFIRRILDVLAAVPSIVLGLFGNAFFCIQLGLGFSIYAGGLTLACMVLPIFIRTSEEGLRNVSNSYRYNAQALGFGKFATLWHLILPLALPSIMAGFTLSVGRALAETAALIFTSGYVDKMPQFLTDSGRALSVHIYDLSMNVPGGDSYAYSAALVLLGLIVMINLLSYYAMKRLIGKRIIAE